MWFLVAIVDPHNCFRLKDRDGKQRNEKTPLLKRFYLKIISATNLPDRWEII